MDTCLGYLRTHLTYARSYVDLYSLQEPRLARLAGFSLCSLQPTDFVTFEIEGIEKWCNSMLIVCQPIMSKVSEHINNRSMCKRLFIWTNLLKSLKSYSDLRKCCVSFASRCIFHGPTIFPCARSGLLKCAWGQDSWNVCKPSIANVNPCFLYTPTNHSHAKPRSIRKVHKRNFWFSIRGVKNAHLL